MKIGLIQLQATENKHANIEKAVCMIKQAIQAKAKLIILPEIFMFRGQIQSIQDLQNISENIEGKAIQSLVILARQYQVNILAGSIYEKAKAHKKTYNTSIFIDSCGKIIGKYRKKHLFQAQLKTHKIQEANLFLAGQKLVCVDVGFWKFGLSICYDLRFPEQFRKYTQKGVNVLTVPSAFTYETGKDHWKVLLRARAIESLSYVIAPNQVGTDARGIRCYGHSMVVDPWGEVIAEASDDKEEIIYATLDQKFLKKKRQFLPGIVFREGE